MDSLKQRFGHNLRYWRKLRGLTQEQLADRLEITVHSVSNMERGVHGPRFATIERLTSLLDVDVTALFHLRKVRLPGK